MKAVSKQTVFEFLERLGSRYPRSETLSLLGGSAMLLLGSLRETMDIDYVGDDIHKNEFQILIEEIANELGLDTEAVPIDRFIPLPEGNEQRKIQIGQFGKVTVYVIDPYSIALSKLDRGSDRDLEDIIFLIQRDQIAAEELERITKDSLSHAGKFDFHPEILDHLRLLKARMK
ncbi:MAG: hypothetical protein DCC59_15670 [Chloroflexi bacterium]|nr:hypothetical protein [Chloroflexi bacterium CFX1]MCK6568350.1 DUF6036 family nucleotidyltransferase [Anaerolineales bacterium]MCQ3953750.1 hypothetical protein [Chloroflexota bacterium]RIK47968.1 MAG: hypothetical protein DCC59_15670 [Chloroflexota bacterium]